MYVPENIILLLLLLLLVTAAPLSLVTDRGLAQD